MKKCNMQPLHYLIHSFLLSHHQATDLVDGDITAILISVDGVSVVSPAQERPSVFVEGVHNLVYEAGDKSDNFELFTIELIVEGNHCIHHVP